MSESEVWEMIKEARLLRAELPTLSEEEQESERQVFKQKWYGYTVEEAERLGA